MLHGTATPLPNPADNAAAPAALSKVERIKQLRAAQTAERAAKLKIIKEKREKAQAEKLAQQKALKEKQAAAHQARLLAAQAAKERQLATRLAAQEKRKQTQAKASSVALKAGGEGSDNIDKLISQASALRFSPSKESPLSAVVTQPSQTAVPPSKDGQIISPATTPTVTTPAATAVLPRECAIASGFRNNCGLHSILHTLFALPEEKIRDLYNTHPIFYLIAETFFNTYELPGEPNIEDLLALKKVFEHPTDREIIWGPIFRSALLDPRLHEIVSESDRQDLADDTFIFHDLLGHICNLMGAKLIIQNVSPISFHHNHMPHVLQYQPQETHQWQVEMNFEGLHFNFFYPDVALNRLHNRKRLEPQKLKGIRERRSEAQFDAVEQLKIDEEVKCSVLKEYRALHPEAKSSVNRLR